MSADDDRWVLELEDGFGGWVYTSYDEAMKQARSWSANHEVSVYKIIKVAHFAKKAVT